MALTFNAAIVTVRGCQLLVIAVQTWIIEDPYEAELIQLAFEMRFCCPVVLMARDQEGVPRFCGHRGLVRQVRATRVDAMRWRRYTIAGLPPRRVPSSSGMNGMR